MSVLFSKLQHIFILGAIDFAPDKTRFQQLFNRIRDFSDKDQ